MGRGDGEGGKRDRRREQQERMVVESTNGANGDFPVERVLLCLARPPSLASGAVLIERSPAKSKHPPGRLSRRSAPLSEPGGEREGE